MKIETVPIEKLSLDPANARKHSARNLETITASLKRFGQQKPIVVDKNFVVRAGNGTLAAAQALGWKTISVARSALTGSEMTAFAIADNRTAELAEWDPDVLAATLTDPDIGDVGFAPDEIDKLLATDDDQKPEAEMPPASFAIYVETGEEQKQAQLLEMLASQSLSPRAMISGIVPSPSVAQAPAGVAVAGRLVKRETTIIRSPRVLQLEGMFDVPKSTTSTQTWDVALDLPKRWNIGVIVGPSGCGKSTVAREFFGENLIDGWEWPADKSVLDGFPASMSIADITGLLGSVGFSSPPAWLKPFHVLSNGQQFRANLARTLAEAKLDGELKVVDEYTSVVDRTVARVGSAAVASTIRRHGLQFVAVACHYDILDWLEPDWVYEPHTGKLARGRLRRDESDGLESCAKYQRPKLDLEIVRVTPEAWKLFKPHHYLSADLNHSAACYVATVEGQPAAFTAVISNPHPTRSSWREHRTVCLPDFQGVGIGNAMSEYIASLYAATGKPYTSVTSHPAMIRHRWRSSIWRMTRPPGMMPGNTQSGMSKQRNRPVATSFGRSTASFEYTGQTRPEEARKFGLNMSRVQTGAA